jgi:hypothetical protein
MRGFIVDALRLAKLAAMPRPILRLPCLVLLLCLALAAGGAQARTAQARIARVSTPVAVLEGVTVRLHWPAGAAAGELHVDAARVDAADLGYAWRDLAWTCPLTRGASGWRCDGALRAGAGASMRLSVDLGDARTAAALSAGDARLGLDRAAATPDLTTLDLTRVPLAWAQALAAQAWTDGRLGAGTLDGEVRVRAPDAGPLGVDADLALAGAGVESADATIAAEGLGGRVRVDYRAFPERTLLTLDAALRGGEFLFGNAYVSLPATPVTLRIDAIGATGEGWELRSLAWHDGDTLAAEGTAAFSADGTLRMLEVALHSRDARALPERYLSGWLGPAGLAGMTLDGALDAGIRVDAGTLEHAWMAPRRLAVGAADGRFRFDGLDGEVRFARAGSVGSALRWAGGALGAVEFGAARLPFHSEGGALRLQEAAAIPLLGGQLGIEDLVLRPPAGGSGLRIEGGIAVDALDLATLATAVGLPPFGGSLSGRIPRVRYGDQRIDFDGGLSIYVFNGTINVSSLSMERPFGVAPTLSADLGLDNLDLEVITDVFDFGSITGRMDGHVRGLRLVDWSPTAFEAEVHTEANRGVRQRISQRAVQNISSVGDASFVSTLQGQLIGLFDDFGYRRIGLSCRLADTVCAMEGLAPAGAGFTILEGSGIPRLTVVGFNRLVDFPTLVERLAAAGSGDVAPVID